MNTNSEGKSIVDLYGPAMEVTDQAAADAIFEELVDGCLRARKAEYKTANRKECEGIVRQNLGYFAGYYNNETRERVERLFKCEHPVFGPIAKNGPPSAERAYSLGVLEGLKLKQRKETN